jgi:hypothetical protein
MSPRPTQLVLASLFAALALGASHAVLADSKQTVIAGSWDSTYGEVRLTQDGDRIWGQYPCCGGGTLSGRIEGSVIKFRWSEPRGAGAGEGVWRVKRDGSLDGSWGQGQSTTDGGAWKLWRSRQIAQ